MKIQYVTKDNERWDMISQKMYGTPFEVQRIIDSNPDVNITERLPPGKVLEIEVLEDNNISVNKDLLPPWKR